MAERDIRKALKKRVESYGGEVRAVAWLGRRNAPDVLVLFPVGSCGHNFLMFDGAKGGIWVEAKTDGGEPTEAQLREHGRMRAAGCTVLVISSLPQLDRWLPPL